VISPFVRIEVSSQSRGFIRSTIDNNILQSMVYGRIDSINIIENQKIEKGDTLVVIGTEMLKEQIDAMSQQMEQNQLYLDDLNAILMYHPHKVKTAKYLSEYNEYYAQIQQQRIQTDFLLREKNTADHLYSKKVIPEFDHLKTVNNHESSVKKEKLIHDQYRRQWHSQVAQLEQDNVKLLANIVQLEEERKHYVVIAPISGSIINYTGIKTGNFLAPNQTIAQISPNTDLIIECYVSPSDIGYIKTGMPLKFQFDAYNYNQWGMGTGTVSEISSDIILSDNQPFFRVRCKMNENYLQLKTGVKADLIKGMTLTARFILTERTLAQLAFDKADRWLNPKLTTNEITNQKK
jgi:HlyD family secretion protein